MKESKLETFVYEYDWDLVIESYMRRYPKHPRFPVLRDTKIVKEERDGQKYYVERQCFVEAEAPGWLKRSFGVDCFEFLQKTTIDYELKTMKIENRNVTYSEKVKMVERCEYRVYDNNPSFTYFEQQATLELPKFPLSSVVEQYIMKSYSKNTKDGRKNDILFIQDTIRERQGIDVKDNSQVQSNPECSKENVPMINEESQNSTQTIVEGGKDSFSNIFHNSSALIKIFTFLTISNVLFPFFINFLPINASQGFTLGSMTTLSLILYILWNDDKFQPLILDLIKSSKIENERVSTSEPSIQKDENDENLNDEEKAENNNDRGSDILDIESENSDSSSIEFDDVDEEENKEKSIMNTSTYYIDNELENLLKMGDPLGIDVEVPFWITRWIDGKSIVFYITKFTFKNCVYLNQHQASEFISLDRQLSKIKATNFDLKLVGLPKIKNSKFIFNLYVDGRLEQLNSFVKRVITKELRQNDKAWVLISEFFCKKFVRSNVSLDSKQLKAQERLSQNSLWQGLIIQVKWRTCANEVHLILTESHIITYDSSGNSWFYLMNNVDNVEIKDGIDIKFPNHFLVEIEFVNKQRLYFLTTEKIHADEIINVIEKRRNEKFMGNMYSYPRKPTIMSLAWPNLQQSIFTNINTSSDKIILNTRIIYFERLNDDPVLLSKNLLEEVLMVFQYFTNGKCLITKELVDKLHLFGLNVCKLAALNLQKMDDHEKLVFYINVYHTLVIHSFLDIGRPTTMAVRKKLQQLACYDLGGYIYSITDIEHGILRSKSTSPIVMKNQLITKLVIRFKFSSTDPRNKHAPLYLAEPRINFVLNTGTQSSIYHVYILSIENLDSQLDHIAKHFFNEQLVIDHKNHCIHLPRICLWYMRDFCSSKAALLDSLFCYFPKSMQSDINALALVPHRRTIRRRAVSNKTDDEEIVAARPMESSLRGKFRIKYCDYEWNARGVFFRGHDDIENCPLLK
ncbi:PRELI/MSF1 domain-containing protein [Rozella allomycis CSF55]|uniref:PRELI/MSF1 domain-containing protein n=1 Tax=Rozella allomycis (strain CSF55) TaxID=988480 RepID=A0A075B0R1_ROZAC|nr:PRELI/MSF1 domain-containing protein [Rozella allomycis CSF55]|eukprot:EPZ36129.1 PRELI/MSF1 domain-containing protein [Rozella allomycis CSF55]